MIITAIISLFYLRKVLFFQRNKPKFPSLYNTWNAAHTYPHYSGFQGYPCTKFMTVLCEQRSIMDKLKCNLVFRFFLVPLPLCGTILAKFSISLLWHTPLSASWRSISFCNTFYYSRILIGEENYNNFIYLYSSSHHTHRINHQKKKFAQVFDMKMNFKMQVHRAPFHFRKITFHGM